MSLQEETRQECTGINCVRLGPLWGVSDHFYDPLPHLQLEFPKSLPFFLGSNVFNRITPPALQYFLIFSKQTFIDQRIRKYAKR